jgi:hypothetical protein
MPHTLRLSDDGENLPVITGPPLRSLHGRRDLWQGRSDR